MHMLKEGSDADSEDFPSKETEVEEGTEHTDRHTEHTRKCIHGTQSTTTKLFNSSCDVNTPKLRNVECVKSSGE